MPEGLQVLRQEGRYRQKRAVFLDLQYNAAPDRYSYNFHGLLQDAEVIQILLGCCTPRSRNLPWSGVRAGGKVDTVRFTDGSGMVVFTVGSVWLA